MMRNTKLRMLAFAFFTLGASVAVGCTNEEDLGGRSPTDADAGATGNEDSGATTDPDGSSAPVDGGGSDAKAATSTFGKTAGGESCDPGDYPAMPASCTIADRYQVTESWCAGGACSATPPSADAFQWTADVSVDGTSVTLTNGTDRNLKCELNSACDCVRSGGSLIRFYADRFIATGKADCPGTAGKTLYSRDVGMKL